ncbi:unnamed protein product [Psylliodes chrysocephalus]|uniref:Uncharacterized protein n=1 Tax=Psylliodes chrysocephalus TaxID=3402493 RepID=A0A9P0CVU6_9CUCU|nr:unnamed protein product [Psylliodes chrysocephala]
MILPYIILLSLPILLLTDDEINSYSPIILKLKSNNVDPSSYNSEYDSLDNVVYIDDVNQLEENLRSKKETKVWDHWGKWSACSVSCGIGKMTRWRHCISKSCAPGEKEAQIKTCTAASC